MLLMMMKEEREQVLVRDRAGEVMDERKRSLRNVREVAG